MRNRLLPVLLLAFTTLPATAQITITRADVEGRFMSQTEILTYEAEDPSSLADLADATGGNVTYDFSNATYLEADSVAFELTTCSEEVPGCDDPDFGSANLIGRELYTGGETDSTAVIFLEVNDDGLYILGTGIRSDIDPDEPGLEVGTQKFVPPLQQLAFPLTDGTSWETESSFITSGLGEDTLGLSVTITDSYEVEGWGTLVTPMGTEPALRVNQVTIFSTSFGDLEFADTTYTVEFITKGSISATLDLDEAGNVTGASYTVTEGLTTDTEGETELPERMSLEQNFPNPFNPATTITFSLQEPQHVTLAIYDMLGRTVATLVDGVRPAGTFEVTWDAGNLPSGLYLYQLRSGTTSLTRQLTLLK